MTIAGNSVGVPAPVAPVASSLERDRGAGAVE